MIVAGCHLGRLFLQLLALVSNKHLIFPIKTRTREVHARHHTRLQFPVYFDEARA